MGITVGTSVEDKKINVVIKHYQGNQVNVKELELSLFEARMLADAVNDAIDKFNDEALVQEEPLYSWE